MLAHESLCDTFRVCGAPSAGRGEVASGVLGQVIFPSRLMRWPFLAPLSLLGTWRSESFPADRRKCSLFRQIGRAAAIPRVLSDSSQDTRQEIDPKLHAGLTIPQDPCRGEEMGVECWIFCRGHNGKCNWLSSSSERNSQLAGPRTIRASSDQAVASFARCMRLSYTQAIVIRNDILTLRSNAWISSSIQASVSCVSTFSSTRCISSRSMRERLSCSWVV